MCAITRTTSEPPSHPGCAEFAARACPFLTNPRMRRNDRGIDAIKEAGASDPAGIHLDRNPGVMCLWQTPKHRLYLFRAGDGVLIKVGHPTDVRWAAHGRAATRAEVVESLDSGFPQLFDLARTDPNDPTNAVIELTAMRQFVNRYLPAA